MSALLTRSVIDVSIRPQLAARDGLLLGSWLARLFVTALTRKGPQLGTPFSVGLR